MEIRRYQASDQEAVWRLHKDALMQCGAFAGGGPWDDDLRNIEAVYLEAGGEFLVGSLEQRVVAMGALKNRDDSNVELVRMRVHTDFQRRGYGQQMLNALEEKARALGFLRIHLDTTSQQKAAQCLYRVNGYQEKGSERFARFELIIFEKALV